MTRQEVEQEIGFSLTDIAAIGRHGLLEDELEALYTTADEISPKVIVEIGACYGISSVLLGFVARKHTGHLYSIECNEQPSWRTTLQQFGVDPYVTLVLGKTPWIDWASLEFEDIDYLLIDGSHNFLPILTDFYTWGCRVRKGGRIALHDHNNRKCRQAGKAIQIAEEVCPMKKIATVNTIRGLVVFEKTAGPKPPRWAGKRYWM